MKEYKPGTKCLHSGYQPKNGEPRVLPLYQSTTFRYESSDEMAKLFDLESNGYFYSRLSNPTTDFTAKKLAELEGGVEAVLTASGQAATFFSLFNILGAGDHFIASNAVYGGSYNLFDVTMRKMGIDVTFIHPDDDAEKINAAFRPNTKAVFAETLSNPSLIVLDIEKFANLAHAHGVPLIVDNTFPTPINCRPFEFGADIVVHSTSKYLDGQGDSLGGAIIDSGNFDWAAYGDKYSCLTSPDDSYHGVVYTGRFGKLGYIMKITAQLMRDLGSTPSPFNSFMLNHGMETLDVRVKRHCENALAVARFLEAEPKVAWVNYPGLESSKYHALAAKYLPSGSSGVISFGLKSGRDGARRLMDSMKLASIVTHVADARTCLLHPASTTHRQMSDEQLLATGVSPDLIRFSVGIEDKNDIIEDLRQAIALV